MSAMFSLQPVLGRLLVQEAGHVIDLSSGAVAFDLPVVLRTFSALKITCASVILKIWVCDELKKGRTLVTINTIKLTHHPGRTLRAF
jgi:hypothetical protein